MICENCGTEHSGKYGSGRFCCQKCARGFSTKLKRKEISEKVSKALFGVARNLTKEQRFKMGSHRRGKKFSKETRLKLSQSHKKNKTEEENKALKGRKFSKETLLKMSLSHKKNKTEEEKKAQNKACVYRYRARKYKAIDGTEDKDLIFKIYKNCPKGYEVDHIIPLSKGGKHHEDNLQYLEARENKRKGNRDKYDKSKVIKWQSIVLFSDEVERITT